MKIAELLCVAASYKHTHQACKSVALIYIINMSYIDVSLISSYAAKSAGKQV